MRTVRATRYVAPLREGGSMPALVEADDDGLYVVKLRGAGQGRLALVAEVLAGELARALDLPVPELVVADVDTELARAEPDPEIQELVQASGGTNAGLDFLPGALPYAPSTGRPPGPDLAAAVVWFDCLVENVDRTPRNPNLLMWHGRLWLIDHGAALFRQHAGLDHADPAAPLPMAAQHVLLDAAGPLPDAAQRLAPKVDEPLLRAIVDAIPPDWFAGDPPEAYVEHLLARVAASDAWTAHAEEHRARRR
ncbi:HipA family kinase [Conexibacter sp. SYSU D00693]|uniref:HipA family kinase n=1 Tax=Conexibacter sp. SYSU D00693 TaxID=2812560 RepID=UPI00196A39EB